MNIKQRYEILSGNTVINNKIYNSGGHYIGDYSKELAIDYIEIADNRDKDN